MQERDVQTGAEMKKYGSAVFLILLLYGLMAGTPVVFASNVSGEGSFVDYGEWSVSGNDGTDRGRQDIVSFQIPENLDFFMDPYGLINGAQIHSQTYRFCNTGDSTVRLTLTDIMCEGAEGVSAASPEAEAEDIKASGEKVICLRLCFENGQIITVTQTPGRYEIVLAPGEGIEFYIDGSMSIEPLQPWQSGDVGISMVYSVDREETHVFSH